MLRDHPAPSAAPSAAPGAADVVLTCGDPGCRHTFALDRHALATGSLACPRCEGWTFTAAGRDAVELRDQGVLPRD